MSPAFVVRNDSFSTPLRPPRNTALSPELISPARRRSKFLSPTLRNTILDFYYGSSATTSICTRNLGSIKRCTCTHEVAGKRSLPEELKRQSVAFTKPALIVGAKLLR